MYNIQNSVHLTTDLQSIEINEDMRICSFNIENMYTNIPNVEVLNIIKNIMESDPETKKAEQEEIINILKSMMEQNYFRFNQQYYKQTEGLAVGAPTYAILAEVYIQYIQHKKLPNRKETSNNWILQIHVNDILIIYNQNKTNIEETLTEFNKHTTSIKFTIEKEQQNSINFLDLTIHQKRTKLEFGICRKPTQTDTIIPNDSCHPHKHKVASINYLINRVHTYPITNEEKTKELNIIHDILYNNEYIIQEIKNNKNTSQQHQTTKWATFTYCGKETQGIAKLFKETNIKITFRTKNTIQRLVKPCLQRDEYEKRGVYQMRCMDCPLKYTVRMGGTFKTRYKEHIQAIRNDNGNSGYSKHILNMRHTYRSVTNTMKVLKTKRRKTPDHTRQIFE
jgi:hypothetical protein